MGSVYRKSVTRPLPAGAELFTKAGGQYARWKPAKGKTRTAKVTTGKDGSLRILDEAGTYIAKFRDGSGYVCEVSTGCRDLDAARSILSKLERRAELVRSEVISPAEAATADHASELSSTGTISNSSTTLFDFLNAVTDTFSPQYGFTISVRSPGFT